MGNLKQTAAQIEKRVKHKLARGSFVYPLPICDGQYAARFGVLTQDAIERLAELAELPADTPDDQLQPIMESLAESVGDACRYLLARPEGGGDYEKLTHDDGRPVLFDAEFAEVLGLEAAPGYDLASKGGVVLACWVTDENELNVLALIGFVQRLQEWMVDTTRPVVGEIVEGQPGGLK